jgi:hypothetical protein
LFGYYENNYNLSGVRQDCNNILRLIQDRLKPRDTKAGGTAQPLDFDDAKHHSAAVAFEALGLPAMSAHPRLPTLYRVFLALARAAALFFVLLSGLRLTHA